MVSNHERCLALFFIATSDVEMSRQEPVHEYSYVQTAVSELLV
jgi:hypothetical protein